MRSALLAVALLTVLLFAIVGPAFSDEDHAQLGSGSRVEKVSVPFVASPSPAEHELDALGPNFLRLVDFVRRPARHKATRPAVVASGAIPDLIRSVFARFGPATAQEAVRVASCETGGTFDPTVVNASGHTGLFQLARQFHEGRAARLGFSWAQMREALPNATVAASLFGETHSWQAWTCKP